MIPKLCAALVVLALVGCENEQSQFSEISPAKLEKPQGFEDCTFKSDNKYNETVLVRCPNSDTSTAVTSQAGKNRRITNHTAVIEDAKEQAVVINDKARKAIDNIDEEQIKADIREAKKGLDEANARFDKIMGILDEASK